MLRLELITMNNFNEALKLQNEIFPEYNGKNNYLDSFKEESRLRFFMIYDDNLFIGLSGIYCYKNDYDNAWLGFFGIKEEFRNKGYGKLALLLTEEYAKGEGYKFMRLFTDKYDNDLAISFYKKYGYVFEDYNSDLEELKDSFCVVIGSKSISEYKVTPWNNRFINLSKQTIKQQY